MHAVKTKGRSFFHQSDRYSCPFALLAVNGNRPMMHFNDLSDNGQPETAPPFLGREKGVEDSAQIFRADAAPRVLQVDDITLFFLHYANAYSPSVIHGLPKKRKHKSFDVEIADEIKSYMSEISIKQEFLANGARLMDLNVPDKTLIVMVKREGQFFIPRGNTELMVGDRILVITDDEDALEDTYLSMKSGLNGHEGVNSSIEG